MVRRSPTDITRVTAPYYRRKGRSRVGRRKGTNAGRTATRAVPHGEPTAMALLDIEHGLAATVPPTGASDNPAEIPPPGAASRTAARRRLPRSPLRGTASCRAVRAPLVAPGRHVPRARGANRRHAADRRRRHRVLWRWRPGRQADPRRDSRHGRRHSADRRTARPIAPLPRRACRAVRAGVEIVVVDNQPRSQETKLVVEVAAARSRHQMRYVAEPRPGSRWRATAAWRRSQPASWPSPTTTWW